MTSLYKINVVILCDDDYKNDRNFFYFLLELLKAHGLYNSLIEVYAPTTVYDIDLEFDLIIVNKCIIDYRDKLETLLYMLKINGFLYINSYEIIKSKNKDFTIKSKNKDFTMDKTFINYPINNFPIFEDIDKLIKLNKDVDNFYSNFEQNFEQNIVIINQELLKILFQDFSKFNKDIYPLLFRRIPWIQLHEYLYDKINNEIGINEQEFKIFKIPENIINIKFFCEIVSGEIIEFLNKTNKWINTYIEYLKLVK